MNKIALLFAAALLSGHALAANVQAYSQSTFDALQRAGKPVLVDVYADWCPVCKRQEAVLSPMLKEASFKDLTVLKMNFDTQKQHFPQFKVSRQSTLILFNQGKEVRRSLGETNADRLRQFITLPR